MLIMTKLKLSNENKVEEKEYYKNLFNQINKAQDEIMFKSGFVR